MPSAKKSPFTFEVLDLTRNPGELRERQLDAVAPEGWGNAVIGVRVGEVVRGPVRLESLHEGILVTAAITTTARGECVRCLTDLEQPVEVEIQDVFAYSQTEAFDYEVRDTQVDLEPAVRDAVVLSLPFQPVCQFDCTGLCPQCGVRLLDAPGHEHEAPIDSRWAALAGLDGFVSASQNEAIGNDNGAETEKR